MGMSPFGIRKASKRLPRLVLAVVAGYVTSVILVLLSFAVLMWLLPSDFVATDISTRALVLTLIIGLMVAVISGAVAAYICRNQAQRATLILGGLMALLAMVTMILEAGAKPLWWHACLIVGVVPSTLLGGRVITDY